MLNPHTFPLLPLSPADALPPELAARAGMGGWEPYAQPVPFDRLPPFVVTRPVPTAGSTATNGPWLNCARIEDADTGALVQTLRPVGYTAGAGVDYDLLFSKYPDPAGRVEYFVYFGGQIQGLALACGRAYRLVVDNAYYSPRFAPFVAAAAFLKVEWWDRGPANGVPYGTGLRQRLWLPNGELQFAKPSTVRKTTEDPATGAERLDFLAKTQKATFAVPPVPRYLAEAVEALEAVAFLEINGQAWEADAVEFTPSGTDSGRSQGTVTVKRNAIIYKASCPAPALADAGYDPARDAAHPWRCGDLTDLATEWQNTAAHACILNSSGYPTGMATFTQIDVNPQSPTYNTTRTGPVVAAAALCPVLRITALVVAPTAGGVTVSLASVNLAGGTGWSVLVRLESTGVATTIASGLTGASLPFDFTTTSGTYLVSLYDGSGLASPAWRLMVNNAAGTGSAVPV